METSGEHVQQGTACTTQLYPCTLQPQLLAVSLAPAELRVPAADVFTAADTALAAVCSNAPVACS